MEENTTFNSFLYEMYQVKQQYGYLIDNMERVQILFNEFYKILEEQRFKECRTILNKLELILGDNNPHIVGARTCLELEEIEIF